MKKEQLRIDYKQRRKALSSEQIDSMSLSIANQCLNLPIWHLDLYHIFLSISKMNEVDTKPLLAVLMGKDKRIAIPKTIPDNNSLVPYELTTDTRFSVNSMGITEPEGGVLLEVKAIDVVFVPLLAFDQKGQRVGYGKGYYDRFLDQCRNDVITVGLSFFDPERLITDSVPSDVPLHFVVNPYEVFDFRKA